MQPLPPNPIVFAAGAEAALGALDVHATVPMRAVRRDCSRELRAADGPYVLAVARELIARGHNWTGWELIRYHPAAFGSLDAAALEDLAGNLQSWDAVDGFARTLAGPAWLHGLIDDAAVHTWARSPDLWWRRAALVCTVALNMRSQGGRGDTPRTLAVCAMLAGDREVMVQKALSWALRELVVHDAEAVQGFILAHETELSALVKREVRNKLATGLKNPPRDGARP